jgi:hypothetical protein
MTARRVCSATEGIRCDVRGVVAFCRLESSAERSARGVKAS